MHEIMKKWVVSIMSLGFVFLLAVAISYTMKKDRSETNSKSLQTTHGDKPESKMRLTSYIFENNGKIPKNYTCDGTNISPPLTISDVPYNSKSLVLIVDDPDAPSGNWVHWLVWNIDPDITNIEEARVPKGGIQGMNDFGTLEWGGPCPSSGNHRYTFKIIALDTKLEVPDESNRQIVEAATRGHILDQTTLVGLYSRR